MTLNAAVRAMSNNDRLTLLEDMFAGGESSLGNTTPI